MTSLLRRLGALADKALSVVIWLHELLPVPRTHGLGVMVGLEVADGTTQFQPGVQARGGAVGAERGVSVAQAARDLDLHQNMLRNWVREFGADPAQAFPGQGQMKPEQAEIEPAAPRSGEAEGRTRHPKKSRRLLREGRDVMFGFVAKHRGIWPVAFLARRSVRRAAGSTRRV